MLNNTVWANLKPSKIHGIGVFAIRDIPKGTEISPEDKTLYEVETLDFILPEIRAIILDRIIFPKDTKIFRFPSPNRFVNLRAFMNHSNTPNTDGVYTLRDIKKGEELTEDYTSFGDGIHKFNLDNFKI